MGRAHETSQLRAGRELDALVAEKVMGELDKINEREFHLMIPSGATLPHYSTRIEDAWQVVEKLATDDVYICIDRYDNKTWQCIIDLDGMSEIVGSVTTAPLAICLAALKAVGYED
jgi:hypothetical protein